MNQQSQNYLLYPKEGNEVISYEQFIKERYSCCLIFRIFIGVTNVICALVTGISFAIMKSPCQDSTSIAGIVISFISIPIQIIVIIFNSKKNNTCATASFLTAGVGLLAVVGVCICAGYTGSNMDLNTICNYQICQKTQESIYSSARLVISVETDDSFKCQGQSEQDVLVEVQNRYIYECNSCDQENITIQNIMPLLITSLIPSIITAVMNINTLAFTHVFKKILQNKYEIYKQRQQQGLTH